MLAVISAFTRGEDLQTPGATSFLASLELGRICMRVSWCVLGAVHQKARETCLCVPFVGSYRTVVNWLKSVRWSPFL